MNTPEQHVRNILVICSHELSTMDEKDVAVLRAAILAEIRDVYYAFLQSKQPQSTVDNQMKLMKIRTRKR